MFFSFLVTYLLFGFNSDRLVFSVWIRTWKSNLYLFSYVDDVKVFSVYHNWRAIVLFPRNTITILSALHSREYTDMDGAAQLPSTTSIKSGNAALTVFHFEKFINLLITVELIDMDVSFSSLSDYLRQWLRSPHPEMPRPCEAWIIINKSLHAALGSLLYLLGATSYAWYICRRTE